MPETEADSMLWAIPEAAATAQLTDRSDFWIGLSGSLTTGEAVAAHLEAAATLMKAENWDPQLYGFGSCRQLRDALRHAVMDGHGDADTRYLARTCMELVLRIRTGAPYVDYEVWTERPYCTLADVLSLLATTAVIARQYGPRA